MEIEQKEIIPSQQIENYNELKKKKSTLSLSLAHTIHIQFEIKKPTSCSELKSTSLYKIPFPIIKDWEYTPRGDKV